MKYDHTTNKWVLDPAWIISFQSGNGFVPVRADGSSKGHRTVESAWASWKADLIRAAEDHERQAEALRGLVAAYDTK